MFKEVRQNTIKLVFNKATRHVKPSPLDIHIWLEESFQLHLDQIEAIQLNNEEYCVYVKLCSQGSYDKFLREHPEHVSFVHSDGSESLVQIMSANDEGTKIRILDLPIELDNAVINAALSKYGTIKKIVNEHWSGKFRFPVLNGVRVVHMDLKQHVPSKLTIQGYRATVTYVGQPQTCFWCRSLNHTINVCPHRNRSRPDAVTTPPVLRMSDLFVGKLPSTPQYTPPPVSTGDGVPVDIPCNPPASVTNEDTPLPSSLLLIRIFLRSFHTTASLLK